MAPLLSSKENSAQSAGPQWHCELSRREESPGTNLLVLVSCLHLCPPTYFSPISGFGAFGASFYLWDTSLTCYQVSTQPPQSQSAAVPLSVKNTSGEYIRAQQGDNIFLCHRFCITVSWM